MPHLWQKGRIEEHTNVRVVRWHIVVFCKRPNRSDVLFRGCEVNGFREWEAGIRSISEHITSLFSLIEAGFLVPHVAWKQLSCLPYRVSLLLSHVLLFEHHGINHSLWRSVWHSKAFGLIASRLCFRTDLKMIRTPSVMEKVEIWEEKRVWKSHRNWP